MSKQETPILSVRNLKQHFVTGVGKNKLVVKAVDGISFDIYKGEVFSLVGESGCGKTTTGRTLIKLYEPTDGEVFFYGKRIAAGTASLEKELKKLKRAPKTEENIERIKEIKLEIKERKKDTNEVDKELMKKMQMIFQDPIASLNPRMVVKEIIAEGMRIAGDKEEEINKRVFEMLEMVGLLPDHASRYPHEFSGGQRQRIGIARALAVKPDLVLADEPVSALDVSIQAQVINLLTDLIEELDLTLLFIAHDLSVVKYISDRIGVMYFGKLVELAPAEELFKNPLHPYTKSLLSAIPLPDPILEKQRKRIVYDPSVHDYSEDRPSFREITPGHFILANDQELEQYKKELK